VADIEEGQGKEGGEKKGKEQTQLDELLEGAKTKLPDGSTSYNAYQLACGLVYAKFMQSQQWAMSSLHALNELAQSLVEAAGALTPKEVDVVLDETPIDIPEAFMDEELLPENPFEVKEEPSGEAEEKAEEKGGVVRSKKGMALRT
jgi:hypothetical protein